MLRLFAFYMLTLFFRRKLVTSLYTSVSDRVWSEYQALAKKGRLEYVNPLNMKEIWKRTGLYHQPFDCGRNKKNALLTFLASKPIGCLFEEIIQGIFQKKLSDMFCRKCTMNTSFMAWLTRRSGLLTLPRWHHYFFCLKNGMIILNKK